MGETTSGVEALAPVTTRVEAEECWLEFVRADPSVVGDLEICDRDENVRLDVDPEQLNAGTAA